jgi:hypothetical protein
MTSKDLSNEKRLQREDKLNLEPRFETEGYTVSGAREAIPTGRSVAERLPRKSDKLRPRTHGGVIRQLIEQGMAQLAEDKTALEAIQRRIDRTQQSMQNLKGLLEDWEKVTQSPPEESK